MKKNNKLRKIEYICIILLIIVMSSGSICVYANQKSNLTNEQNSIDKQIEDTNSEIAGVQSQMSNTLNQINNYNSQISTYEDEISTLEQQVSNLQGEIKEKEANIKEQEEKYAEQQEMLEKKLVAMYERGTTSYLDMLLSSDGLADFISKYYIIEQLAEYDNELLEAIENTKSSIENDKKALEEDKNKVESSKTEVVSKRNSLSVIVDEKNALVNTLSVEERQLEEQLEQYEQDKRDIQRKLDEIYAQEEAERKRAAEEAARKAKVASSSNSSKNNSNNSSNSVDSSEVKINSSGFASPLAGKTKANITTGMHGYSGHTGVDWAIAAGTPILASKSGTVVISTALKNSNGTYRSYGEYIAISHGDGTQTLYAHMSKRVAQEGDKVNQGQVIGYVGSTGNSTGNHLHFEIRIGTKRVDPALYLP